MTISTEGVLSDYIANCALVAGTKVDLRMYVVVRPNAAHTAVDTYLFREGLVRFASIPYDLSDRDITLPETLAEYTFTSSPIYQKYKLKRTFILSKCLFIQYGK